MAMAMAMAMAMCYTSFVYSLKAQKKDHFGGLRTKHKKVILSTKVQIFLDNIYRQTAVLQDSSLAALNVFFVVYTEYSSLSNLATA